MANSRRKSINLKVVKEEEKIEEIEPKEQKVEQTNPEINDQSVKKIYLSEEDKRFLKKVNKHIVNKLGLHKNRSIKI